MRIGRSTFIAAVVGVISLAPTLLVSATAAISAYTANTSALSVGTGTFKIYPSATTGGAATGAAITLIRASGAQFLFIKNSGTIDTAKFTIDITWASSSSTTLKNCPLNTTFSSATTCSDSSSPTTIFSGISSGTAQEVTFAIPAGSYLPISITPSAKDTPTISSSVSSIEIRTPKVTFS
jgi:hypothetical protein